MSQLVQTPLWGHQQTELDRLDPIKRSLIGWQMGTGKTLGAIEKDLRFRATYGDKLKKTLVVAPLSTHDSWEQAWLREAPGLRVVVIDPKDRLKFLKTPGDVYILHYEVLRLMPGLRGVFQHGIFDECHKLKNRKAKQTVAAKLLQIPLLTDMSGSPATDRPHDIWSPLNHLYPKTYSSYWKFFEQNVEYELVPPQNFRKATGPTDRWINVGLPRIRPFYSRVLKKDVLKDLPDKTYETLYVDLTPTQRKHYNEMRDEMIAWIKDQDGELSPLAAPAMIARLQRLQMFALGTMEYVGDNKYKMVMPSSKVSVVADLIRGNEEETFLVYSQFKGPLYLLHDELTKDGRGKKRVHASLFTGDESHRSRRASKDDFVKGNTRVLAATISAIGTGTDGLQNNCSTAIFLDRDWSPMLNEQAEDRLHRGGQKNPVTIIDVVARNTVDGERNRKVELKKKWVLQTLGDI